MIKLPNASARGNTLSDISAEIRNICLCNDEHGMISNMTDRVSSDMQYKENSTLDALINTKVQNQTVLPLVLRKQKLYQDAKRKNFIQLNFSNYPSKCDIKIFPINMRKHVLYNQVRAG